MTFKNYLQKIRCLLDNSKQALEQCIIFRVMVVNFELELLLLVRHILVVSQQIL